MRGAATSVTRDIAEGYCRASLNEYIRFCEIAKGSLGELGSDIHHCERVGLLKGEELEKIVALYSETSYLLISRQKQGIVSMQRRYLRKGE